MEIADYILLANTSFYISLFPSETAFLRFFPCGLWLDFSGERSSLEVYLIYSLKQQGMFCKGGYAADWFLILLNCNFCAVFICLIVNILSVAGSLKQ